MTQAEQLYTLQKGTPSDVPMVVALIQARIDWMEKNGISQWSSDRYLFYFNQAYFTQKAEEGCLYVLYIGDVLAGSIVLTTTDFYWKEDGTKAWYLHNFATSLAHPHAGEWMLKEIEALARKEGKQALRLDAQTDNRKLHAYYEKQGFAFVDVIDSEDYDGSRREKRL